MILEGFFFLQKTTFLEASLYETYDKLILSDNGYLGVKSGSGLKNFPSDYFGVVSDSKNKEVKSVSESIIPDFASFSLDDLLANQRINLIGVCAWFNSEANKLYLSRDAFGIIPFYYCQVDNEIIAFSTDLVSLITNPHVKRHIKINLQRLALYGSALAEVATPYKADTFYEKIQSVPPGHLVTLDFNNISVKANVIFRPSKWSNLTRLEEYGEEFRGIFLNSVQRNLRQGQVLASHLSGGMDSSSVSAAIRLLSPDLPLQTLYNKSNTLDTDENQYAISVARKIGSVHHEILQSEDDIKLLSAFTALAGQPSSTLISPSATASLMHFAKELGCNAIFNGTGGDSIVGSGLEMMGTAFDNHQWDLLKALVTKRTSFYSHSHKYSNWNTYTEGKRYDIIANNLFFKKLTPLVFQGNLKAIYRLFTEFSSNFDVGYGYILNKILKSIIDKVTKGHFNPVFSILNDDLLALHKYQHSLNIEEVLEARYSQAQGQALLDVFNLHTIFSNEHIYSIAQHYSMGNYSPFYDKDLFELCIAVPDIVKFGDGIGRAHFREAMTGLLPENVRRRSTKTPVRSLGPQIVMRMYNQSQQLLMDTSEVWNYVNRKKFALQLAVLKNDKIPYEQKSNTLFLISRTISLAIWLEWYGGNR